MSRPILFLLAAAAAFAAPPAVLVTPGQMLVATEKSTDPDFARSVVLVIRSDEHGVVGLWLNRPSDVPIGKVFPRIRSQRVLRDRVFLGGPVAIGAYALVRRAELGAGLTRLLDGVLTTGDSGVIVRLAETGLSPDGFRVYAGYVGWSSAQLSAEIHAGLWKTVPGSARAVFSTRPDLLWAVLSR